MTLVLIDHRDSFTYNLVHALSAWVDTTHIIEYNTNQYEQVQALKPTAIILGPGPGNPSDYPESLNLIAKYENKLPILGICLGHQMIGHYYGCHIKKNSAPIHGKSTSINHNGKHLFTNLPNSYQVGRYHSLIIDPSSVPPSIEVTATDHNKDILGIKHLHLPIFGVQFHPESVLSELHNIFFINFKHQLERFNP